MRMNLINITVFIIAAIMLSSCDSARQDPDRIVLRNYMDTVSYIIGLDYGTGIREENIEANRLAIYKGLNDGLDGKSIISDSVKEAIIDEFNEELETKMEEESKQMMAKQKQEGRKFMEENAQQDGVVELPDGLQYKILKEGKGSQPGQQDSVLVHYRAMYTDRTVFDMSYDRGPAGIRLNNVIKGLSEGIQLMKEGAIYELYIPPELAYGDKNFAGVIPAGSTLVYSIELIEIVE
jgi:FKBP-type peptidyl-prolyl cis-trans isomerase